MKEYITQELVRKAQDGDRLALGDLIVRSDDLIRKTIYSFPLATEAEDLLQDIRIKIIEKLPELKNAQAYLSWLKTLSHNHCLNYLEKKRPYLLDAAQDMDGNDEEVPSILEAEGLAATSQSQFERLEASLEHKERIEKAVEEVGIEALGLLSKVHVHGLTLKELVALDTLKKSALDDKIKITGAQWILKEANEDWLVSDYQEAKDKLSLIITGFKPTDSSREKKYFLASALSRLGDICQVQGQIYGSDKSIDFYLRAKNIWDALRDKNMAFYAVHMIALGKNITQDYTQALKYLEETKEGYKGKDSLTKQRLGELERDVASIYLSMGDINAAKRHLERSLAILETIDHRESYYAALRKKGEIMVMLKQFDRAYSVIEDSVKESPPYRALHHLQAKVAKVKLFLSANEYSQGLKYAAEAESDCRRFGFHHQLTKLHEILSEHSISRLI